MRPVCSKRRTADQSRRLIAQAAGRAFAEKGFDRTTIRSIASSVGCDPALVMRYFGSKRELFFESVDLELDRLPAASPGNKADLVSAVEAVLEHWHRDHTFIGVLRSAATDEAAANMMRDFFEKRVRRHQTRVFGLPPAQAVLFGSMLMGIAFAREITKLPPIAECSSRELAEMVGAMLTNPGSCEERNSAQPEIS